MKKVTILLAVLVMAAPAFGATYPTPDWIGTTGSYHDGANWSTGTAPPATQVTGEYWKPDINNGGTALITQDHATYELYVGKYSGLGHVEMSAGNYTGSPALRVGFQVPVALGLCTFTQTGGYIALSGSFTIGDGGIHATNGNQYGSGQYTISGGSLSQINSPQYRYIALGRNTGGNYPTGYGIGIFKVVGTGPTSITAARFNQYPGSTLEVELDATAGHVTPINTLTTNALYTNTLEGTLLVKNGAGYTPTVGTIVTILTATGADLLDFTALTMDAGSDANWNLLADDGTKTSVQVEYIPEPATMVLLGIGGIGVLIRRRRA